MENEVKEAKQPKKVNKIVYILLALFFGYVRYSSLCFWALVCWFMLFVLFGLGSLLTFFFGLGLFILGIEELFCIYDVIKAALTTADANGDIVI